MSSLKVPIAVTIPDHASGALPPIVPASEGDEVNVTPQGHRPPSSVDTTPLTGLRGLAAIHIMVSHYLLFTTTKHDLLGGASMPLFYLMSGLIMTLGYGKDLSRRPYPGEPDPSPLALGPFLRKRIARLYPVYMLVNCAELVIYSLGIGPNLALKWPAALANFVLTAFGLNMWLLPFTWVFPFPITLPTAGVTWTVQTMLFFYVCFPRVLAWLRERRERGTWVEGLYHAQWVVFVFILILVTIKTQDLGDVGAWVAYFSARGWPPSRLLVFVMGCAVGADLMHAESEGWSVRSCFCGVCYPLTALVDVQQPATPKTWGKRATVAGAAYAVAVVLLSFAPNSSVTRLATEALGPLLFIHIMVCLCRSGGVGTLARLCNSRAMQLMGEVSMSVYMLHLTVLLVLGAAVKGYSAHDWAGKRIEGIQWADSEWTYPDKHHCRDLWKDDPALQVALGKGSDAEVDMEQWRNATGACEQVFDDDYQSKLAPAWLIPVCLLVSLLLGFLVTRFYEQPVARLMRPGRAVTSVKGESKGVLQETSPKDLTAVPDVEA